MNRLSAVESAEDSAHHSIFLPVLLMVFYIFFYALVRYYPFAQGLNEYVGMNRLWGDRIC